MKGKINIGRVDTDDGSKIEVIMVDRATGTEICKATMSVENFGLAVTGLGSRDADIELIPTLAKLLAES